MHNYLGQSYMTLIMIKSLGTAVYSNIYLLFSSLENIFLIEEVLMSIQLTSDSWLLFLCLLKRDVRFCLKQ